jgi:hypothetical protein
MSCEQIESEMDGSALSGLGVGSAPSGLGVGTAALPASFGFGSVMADAE